MKRLITGGAACVLALAMTVSALAMWVPSDTTVQNLNGVQQYIKVFTVPADTNPEVLIEEPFEYEGFTYTFAEITKQEHTVEAQKEHTETLVVETQKKDLVNVLEVLTPTIEYDNGHYSGVLALDHTAIRTEPAGYTSGSYTIRETKEIGNLDSNDMAYVPQTTVKDGKTLQLETVDWQVQSTALVDDVLVPSSYVAVATYAGKATYSKPTGYITTAEYRGVVSCDEVTHVTYTVLYVGAKASQAEDPAQSQSGLADVLAAHKMLVLGGVAALALIAVGTAVLIRARRNAHAVAEDEENAEEEQEDETEK